MSKLFYLTNCLVFSICVHASAADVYVAVHKTNTTAISEQSVVKILKAEKLTWEDGKAVVLLIDSLDSTNAKDFDEVTHMSKSQFIEYWRIKFFSGRALIPRQIRNQSTALSVLSENENGVYISIGKEFDKELTESKDIRIVTLKF